MPVQMTHTHTQCQIYNASVGCSIVVVVVVSC